MEQITLTGTRREHLGTPAARRLRRTGEVPAVVYGHGKAPVSLSVRLRDLQQAFHTKAGTNVIINLHIGGSPPPAGPGKGRRAGTARAPKVSPPSGRGTEARTVIVKEIQHDPVRGDVLHIDFHQISLKDRITVNIPVHTQGEAIGVKQDGGVLEHFLRELEIECLPTDIPEHITVDIAALKIGETVHVSDVATPPNAKIVNDPSMAILSVLPPRVEKAPEVLAAEAAPAEPELIRKKKEEEAGAETAPAEGAKAEAEPRKTEGKKEGK